MFTFLYGHCHQYPLFARSREEEHEQFTGEGAAWSPAVQIKAGAGTLRRPIAKI